MDSARLSLISLPSWLCLWGVLFRLLLLHLQPTVTPASLLHVMTYFCLLSFVVDASFFWVSILQLLLFRTVAIKNAANAWTMLFLTCPVYQLCRFCLFDTYILLSRWAWRWPPTWKTAWTATSSTCSALFDRSAARTSGPSWCCRGWRCPSTWHSTHLPSAGSCSVSRTELQRYLLRLYWKSGARWERRRGTTSVMFLLLMMLVFLFQSLLTEMMERCKKLGNKWVL